MLTFTEKCEMIRYDYPPLPSLELPDSFEIKNKKKRFLSDYFYQGKINDIRNYFKTEKTGSSLFRIDKNK
jgi:hypothetical protein